MSKTVIDDPDYPALPIGCITARALNSLVRATVSLENHHELMDGAPEHLPCLRRLESSDGAIVAHLSTGPSVGGSWHKLTYQCESNTWSLS